MPRLVGAGIGCWTRQEVEFLSAGSKHTPSPHLSAHESRLRPQEQLGHAHNCVFSDVQSSDPGAYSWIGAAHCLHLLHLLHLLLYLLLSSTSSLVPDESSWFPKENLFSFQTATTTMQA